MLTKVSTTPTRAPIARWRAWLRARPLAREIGVVLIVKLVVLAGLWCAFFRDAPPPSPEKLFVPAPPRLQETTR
jgi:hypothetical protein